MQKLKIVSRRIGFSNSILLVNGANSILIDTGAKGHLKSFIVLLKQHNLQPSDIKLIVLTHTHYDHTGNLIELVKLTRAKVLVHKNEFENLKKGFTPIPSGTLFLTKIIVALGRWLKPSYASPESFEADLINTNETNLAEYGIEAKVISTPGHTSGSQSVLIENTLIAGDTFFNIRNKMLFPPFANNPKTLIKTWEKMIKLGVKEIYPAHGSPISIEKIIPVLEKLKRKY